MKSRRELLASPLTFVDQITLNDRAGASAFARAMLGNAPAISADVATCAAESNLPLQHWLAEVVELTEVRWDPSKHPRRGTPPNPGWFAAVNGQGSTAGITLGKRFGRDRDENPDDPSDSNAGFKTLPLIIGKTPLPNPIEKGPFIAGRHRAIPVELAMAMPNGRGRGNRSTKPRATEKATRPSPGLSAEQSDPSRWYLPSDEKGTWTGEKGKSTFKLKTPIKAGNKTVREIKYSNGLPILDAFELPGKPTHVVLTGDRIADIRNATEAWYKNNPGKVLPPGATFHHDLRNVIEETVELDGKKTKVLIGKMQLVPTEIHRTVFHEGSASAAAKIYRSLNIDVDSVKKFAKEELSRIKLRNSLLARAARKMRPGIVPKSLTPFIGRNVRRVIPLIGPGLAILDFAENAEAHGVAGAIARATPLLGDLIAAHDLGTELAKQITDEANAKVEKAYRDANEPVADAWQKASEQTVEAFKELAAQIEVTNEVETNGRVDAQEIADALNKFRQDMQGANYSQSQGGSQQDFDNAASQAKKALRARLTNACQKNRSRQTPIL
ncbi:MAG: hypothetical protein KF708_11390 [Pirellulales bacterium]|nr:hypothetical protein [Pirellulales bacterium]